MSLLKHAQLNWDENGQPESQQYGDVYFSRKNGLEETRYVFIKHNHLEERFKSITEATPLFTIGEIGFGTGLNFLCTLQTFLQTAPPYAQLHFISTEKYPLQKVDLQKALALWPALQSDANTLIKQYPPLFSGFYNLSFANHRVRLTLLFGDAAEQLACLNQGPVHAWYLDGFAPAKNPELWNESLLKQVTRLSEKGTTFSTFSAASSVNRALTQIGFHVEKTHGFANKREMLFGSWLHELSAPIGKPYFQFSPPATFYEKKAVVIGGGLAGTTTAWSLANRGWSVTVIDKHKALAQESSGNRQGVIYARLSAFNNTINKFTVQAYQHSLNFLNDLYQNKQPGVWSPCGVLQLAFNEREQKRFEELNGDTIYPEEIIQPVSAEKATAIAGIPVTQPGLYFPHGGWVNPPAFCNDLVNHPNISLQLNTSINELAFDEQKKSWLLFDADKNIAAEAPLVIIANNKNAAEFAQTKNLPLKLIRGQITHLKSTPLSQQLQTVVCAERYLTPAQQQIHSLGATFDLNDDDAAVRDKDHQINLNDLANGFPDLYSELNNHTENQPPNLQGRVGFRTVTPDTLPIVGPAPVEAQFIEDFAALRHNANAPFTKKGTYYPGLFINTAHGSRGLLTCPLSAELLAAYINQEVLPLENDIAELLHPARFVIKDLIRRKC